MHQHEVPTASAMWLFEHVFGDARGHMVTFTGRQARLARPDARPNELAYIQQKYFRYPDEAAAADVYLKEQAKAGRDTYYGVHLFREPGSRLAKNTVGAMSCLWLDEDEGRFPDIGPEPTAIVHSSKKRRHLYWGLTRLQSAEWIGLMNKRLAAWAGGDSGKAGLASVLRVPGTKNFKRHPVVDDVAGWATGVHLWEPEILEQAVPPLSEPERNPRRGRKSYDGPAIELLDYLDFRGVEILYEAPDGGGQKFAVICPRIDRHTGGDRSGTYAGQYSNGVPWLWCYHEHCQADNRLSIFRRLGHPKRTVNLRASRVAGFGKIREAVLRHD